MLERCPRKATAVVGVASLYTISKAEGRAGDALAEACFHAAAQVVRMRVAGGPRGRKQHDSTCLDAIGHTQKHFRTVWGHLWGLSIGGRSGGRPAEANSPKWGWGGRNPTRIRRIKLRFGR